MKACVAALVIFGKWDHFSPLNPLYFDMIRVNGNHSYARVADNHSYARVFRGRETFSSNANYDFEWEGFHVDML
jgi:hypothetical protein